MAPQKFVIQSATGKLFLGYGEHWADHPIAARWFDEPWLADAVLRRNWSQSGASVQPLNDDRTGIAR